MCSQFSMKLRPITQEYFHSQILTDTWGTLKGEQPKVLKCPQHELNNSSQKWSEDRGNRISSNNRWSEMDSAHAPRKQRHIATLATKWFY